MIGWRDSLQVVLTREPPSAYGSGRRATRSITADMP